jgi:orotate phosphoribosyltransferase
MNEILTLLKNTNALLTDDHFVYTSGKHGSVYINKDLLYIHTEIASRVGKLFADKVANTPIDVVAAPALGGIVLSQWTAFHLSQLQKKDVLAVYTEKTAEKNQVFTRGYDSIVQDKKVFVIEDLVTTGTSVKKVIESVNKANGTVVQVGVMVNRSPASTPVLEISPTLPFFSLGRLPVEVYDQINCPLCLNNIPINRKVGHGKKFLESVTQ